MSYIHLINGEKLHVKDTVHQIQMNMESGRLTFDVTLHYENCDIVINKSAIAYVAPV